MDRIVLDDVVVDLHRGQVFARNGDRLDLRPRAFAVLRRLAIRPCELVSKDELLSECWPDVVVTEDSLTQCISEIRRVLGDRGRDLVRTVPRRGYVLTPPDAPAVPRADSGPPPGRFWQPIAVLPFDSFDSERPGFAGLGAGFAEDLTTELARNRHLTVIARQSAFSACTRAGTAAEIAQMLGARYVLEGSLRHAGDDIIVNAQLIDGRDSRHVWAERHMLPAHRFFVMQDALIARIVSALFSELREAEQLASLSGPTASLGAHDLTMRAIAHLNQFSRHDMLLAHATVERALALDPSFSTAHSVKGIAAATDAALAISGTLGPEIVPAAEAAIRRGLELNPASPIGHRALGYTLTLQGHYQDGLEASLRSLALAPHDAGSFAFLSIAQTAVGLYDVAQANAEKALDLSPVAAATFHVAAASAHYAFDRYEEAARYATAAAERSPGYTIAYALGAAADAARGRTELAAARIAALRRVSPGFGLHSLRLATIYGSDTELSRRFVEALQRCGLPGT
ncbi:Transcriptional regulator HilA [Methylobacterium gnaphalii]|nr:Transcriptional regulator HilA [Methylobacterium gnaphalii]